MPWSVRYLDAARRQFLDLPKHIRSHVDEKVRLLEETPFPAGCKKLRHSDDYYRIRVGQYRVIYQIDQPERVVRIMRIRHRKDVYRGL